MTSSASVIGFLGLDGVLPTQYVATAIGVGVIVFFVWFVWGIHRDTDITTRDVGKAAAGTLVIVLILATIGILVSFAGGPAEAADLLGITAIENPAPLLLRGVVTLAIIVAAYLLTGVLKRLVHDLMDDQAAITQHQTELTYRLSQVGLYLLGLIIILGVWDVNLSGLLVGAGFLGIVLGLAAQKTIGSLVAGFVLMFSRPFEVGDWIVVGDQEGIVTEISIVNTRVHTFDGEYAMLPNDLVASTEIINRTRKGRLRVHVDVGVDYDTDLDEAAEIAVDVMKTVEEALTVPQPQVLITGFGDSSIHLDLRYWIDKPSARRVNRSRMNVIRGIHTAFDEAGIKIPYPQRELMGRTEEGGFRLVPGTQASVEVTPDGGPDETG